MKFQIWQGSLGWYTTNPSTFTFTHQYLGPFASKNVARKNFKTMDTADRLLRSELQKKVFQSKMNDQFL